ncbi:MAG: hypothetical protein ACR2P5_04050 [Gammaproteobacteria bacterium]
MNAPAVMFFPAGVLSGVFSARAKNGTGGILLRAKYAPEYIFAKMIAAKFVAAKNIVKIACASAWKKCGGGENFYRSGCYGN